jgi:hypothetical protein
MIGSYLPKRPKNDQNRREMTAFITSNETHKHRKQIDYVIILENLLHYKNMNNKFVPVRK